MRKWGIAGHFIVGLALSVQALGELVPQSDLAQDSELLWIEQISFPTHYFTISGNKDSQGNKGGGLFIDYGFNNGVRASVGLSSTSVEVDKKNLKVRSIVLGVGTDPQNPFSYGLEIESWGIPNELVMNGGRLVLGGNVGDWSLQLSPGLRRYKFSFKTDQFGRPEYIVDAQALSAEISYFGWENFWVRLTGQRYVFYQDLSLANQGLLRGLFTQGASSLSSSLVKSGSGLEFGYGLDKWGLSVFVGQQTNALDSRVSNSINLNLAYNWNSMFSNNLSLGVHRSDGTEEDLRSVDFGLTISWK